MRQLFERLPPAPVADAGDARFEHFKKHVWPRIRSGGNGAIVDSLLTGWFRALVAWCSGRGHRWRISIVADIFYTVRCGTLSRCSPPFALRPSHGLKPRSSARPEGIPCPSLLAGQPLGTHETNVHAGRSPCWASD